jgi:hypothetical protein
MCLDKMVFHWNELQQAPLLTIDKMIMEKSNILAINSNAYHIPIFQCI